MVFVGAPAFAAPASNQAVEEAAKARYNEGLKLYGKKRYEEARVAFLQASALQRRPSATLMLAQSSLRAGRWLEAARSFDEFVVEIGEVPENIKAAVEKGRKEAASHLGRLKFDVPDGAEATVDGEKVDLKEPVPVAAGPHSIVITHRDEKKTLEVDAPAGKTTDVHPNFVPKAIIPTADTRTRPQAAPSPAASSVSSSSSAEHPEESSSIFTPPETKWPMYVAGAVGVGGLVSAAIFGGLAANARHGVEVANETIARNAKPGANCNKASSFDDPAKGQNLKTFEEACITLDRQQAFATANQAIFTTSLVVGLAGMAGALTWFLVAPRPGAGSKGKEKVPTEGIIVPWVGPTGAGATWEGRF